MSLKILMRQEERIDNVENGEILSLVSLPDFDINKRVSVRKKIS